MRPRQVISSAVFFISLSLVCIEASAQEDLSEQETRQTIAASLDELRRAILVRDELIKTLFQRIQSLERSVQGLQSDMGEGSLSSALTPEISGSSDRVATIPLPEDATDTSAIAEADPLPPALNEDQRREQEQLIRSSFERTLIDKGGLLLPPGTVEISPSFSYTHSSSDNIVIDGFTILPILVIGDIFSERIRRQSVQSTISIRAGMANDFQAEIRIPYGYQHLSRLSADNEETNTDAHGLGDIDLTLSHQFLRGTGRMPDIVGGVTWKTTTGGSPFEQEEGLSFGSGYNSLRGSITVVKVKDPVVFFGSTSYTFSPVVYEDIGRFDPGDTFGIELGLALALNLDTALSFGFEQHFTRASTLDDLAVPGSYISTGTFLIGTSFALGQNVSIDFSVGIGLTEDAPDMQMGITVPFRMSF